MVHYELVRVIINAPGVAEVIINIVIRYYGLPNFIINDCGKIFTSKFWYSLCYFFGIKRQLFTMFYFQTDGQMEQQDSMIKVSLWAFVNFKQNNWTKFLSIAEFAYNNAKNVSTNHTLFELNYNYHLWMLYKEEVNSYSKFKSANKLLVELRKLIIVCQENSHHAQKFQK